MKTREEMIRDIHRRIREYEAERRKKRARAAVITASLTPVCGAAVLGTVLLKGGIISPSAPPVLTPDGGSQVSAELTTEGFTSGSTEITAAETLPVTTASFSDVTAATETETAEETSAAAVQTEAVPVTTDAAEGAEAPAETAAPAEDNTVPGMTVPTEQPAGNADRLLISSYPSPGSESMTAPRPGHSGMAWHLYEAKEEYRDTADYHVKADIFTESDQVLDAGMIQAEAERLSGLGYDVKVESEPVQTGGDYYYLAFVMTYEQLEDFPASPEYGYVLRLYDY